MKIIKKFDKYLRFYQHSKCQNGNKEKSPLTKSEKKFNYLLTGMQILKIKSKMFLKDVSILTVAKSLIS